MNRPRTIVGRLIGGQQGASLAEYALILSLTAIALVMAVLILSDAIQRNYMRAEGAISAAANGSGGGGPGPGDPGGPGNSGDKGNSGGKGKGNP